MTENMTWETRPNGQVRTGPLTGWEFHIHPMAAIFRFEAAMSEDQLRTGDREALQVVLTASQLRLLATDLLKSADRIEEQPLGTRQ